MRRLAALQWVLPYAVIVAAFALWEAAVWVFDIPQFVLPAPSAVFASMAEWREPILENALQTLMTSVLGFALAVVVGVVLGTALGASALVYRAIYPLLIGFNAVPKVAVVPILVVWFGIGTVPAVITAFLLSFFPIVVNVATGIATVEPELRDVLRARSARVRSTSSARSGCRGRCRTSSPASRSRSPSRSLALSWRKR